MKPALLAAACLLSSCVLAQGPCERLVQVKLSKTQIISAVVAEGHCAVKGIARPTSDSEIKFELWMPLTGWNGKYLQAGNGGWAGSIPAALLTAGVARGYAVAGTNDGHDSPSASELPAGWAIGHPEKLIDFGHRALHETGIHSMALIEAFYGKPARRKYFVGCSDGGREALAEAQRYPEDFDGIIAGAPANDWSNHFAGFVSNEQALLATPAGRISPAKLPAIQKAALAACDELDKVKDGLIEDPRQCRFDPTVLECNGAETNQCLTLPQIATLRTIYAGPRNPRTGKPIYPGYPPGHEAAKGGWQPWIITEPADKSIQMMFGNSFFGQAVFEDPNWDFRKLDLDSDVVYAGEKAGAVINSNSPDLRSFRANGGKLIQYHGWGDAAIAPMGSIEYYEKVKAFMSKHPAPRGPRGEVPDFYRLFMVPGMGHCGGGVGPSDFGNNFGRIGQDPERDLILALERWVEKGVAPERFIGQGITGDSGMALTRPICPYPKVARYNGSGDPLAAENFSCQ